MDRYHSSINRLTFFVMVVFLGISSGWILAEPEFFSSENLFDLSLEELMDIPVISASRLPTLPQYLSVPVTVITAEDIHASGVTSIPEILQFVPGVDVRRLDRQRTIVGVRGLMGAYSDRTLILLDGQPVMDIVFGTTRWQNLPVMIENIERIEVVRGPVGAAWGANAFTGAINIITKKPGDCLGGFFSTTFTEYGDSYSHLRYGESREKWNWSVSAGYENKEDSDAAGAGRYDLGRLGLSNLLGFSSYEARDWGRYGRFDGRAEYQVDELTKWSGGIAHSNGEEGDFEFGGIFPRKDIQTEYTRAFLRMDHHFDEDTSTSIQWTGDLWEGHYRAFADNMKYMKNNLEAQYTFKPAEDHTASVGGNLRWDRMGISNHSLLNEFVFEKDRYNEYWAGCFLIDRWEVTDRLIIEGQGRLDYFSETTTDWSARLTALYALDEQQDHIVRAGVARSFRVPSLMIRSTTSSYLQAPVVGSLFIQSVPGRDVHNESIYSLEAGYAGRLSEDLSLNLDVYYQRMEHVIGVRNTTDMFGVTTGSFDNVAGITAWGAEPSITWQAKNLKVTAWYAYNAMETDEFGQQTRAILPAPHKVGVTGRIDLDRNWTLNANYAYQNCIHDFSSAILKDPEPFHRLDLILLRQFAQGKGEWTIGVLDVLNKVTDPVYDNVNITALETPGRTFFARLEFRF